MSENIEAEELSANADLGGADNKESFDTEGDKQSIEEFVLDNISDHDSVDNVLAEANSLPSPACKTKEPVKEEEITLVDPPTITNTSCEDTDTFKSQPTVIKKPDPPASKLQDPYSRSSIDDAPGMLEPSSSAMRSQQQEQTETLSNEMPPILKVFLGWIVILVIVMFAMQIVIGIEVLQDSSDDASILASAVPTATKEAEQPSITIAPATQEPLLPTKPTQRPSRTNPPFSSGSCVSLPENTRQALENAIADSGGNNLVLCSTDIIFDQEIQLDYGIYLECEGECIFNGNNSTRFFSFGSARSPLTDNDAVYFANIIFQYGRADGNGGAIVCFGDNVGFGFVNCAFLDNRTNRGCCKGGALHIDGGAFRIIDCDFFRNFAFGGGAVSAVNSAGSIVNSYFINNTILEYWEGNAISVLSDDQDPDNLKLFNCYEENVFVGNRGGSEGEYFEPDILIGEGVTSEGCNVEWIGITSAPTETPSVPTVSPDSPFWQTKSILIGEEYNRFGDSVTLSDDGSILAVVGYNITLETYTKSGYIQVFELRDDGNYQLGENIIVPLDGYTERISISSSSDGYSIAVGTGENDNSLGISQAGQVRTFFFTPTATSDGEWMQIGQTLEGFEACQSFGYSVSLSSNGTTVVIGAPYAGGGSPCNEIDTFSQRGQAEVFSLVGDPLDGQWRQLGQTIFGRDGDNLGSDVSISKDGQRVAARTSRWDDDGATSSALVYELGIRSAWGQLGFEIMAEISEFYTRGLAMSRDGNRIAIASKYMANGVAYVNVWEWLGERGTWAQVGSTIEDSDECCDYYTFENSVAFSEDANTLIFGNQGHGRPDVDGDEFRGIVRVYKLLNGSWVQIGSSVEGDRGLAEGEIWFGYSVAISSNGMRFASGAPSGGHVKVYDLEEE